MKLAVPFKNRVLDLVESCFVSLHQGDPGVDGAHEVTGGKYERQYNALGPARGGNKANTVAIEFTGLPECDANAPITHVGFWTGDGAGSEFWMGGPLARPITVPPGAGVRFQANMLVLSQATT